MEVVRGVSFSEPAPADAPEGKDRRRSSSSNYSSDRSSKDSNGIAEWTSQPDIEIGESGSYHVVTEQIPPELLEQLMRDFTYAEIDIIFARIHKTLAQSSDHPGALFVLGPSAVGKSVLSAAQATVLFGNDNNAVIIDGSEFREVHAGWQAVTVHGLEHGVLHADAWTIFRNVGKKGPQGEGISSALKRRILHEAIRDRQNLIIPDCANHPARLQAQVKEIRDAGYELHCICLWAPLSKTRARGQPRSMREGKLWSPDEYSLSVQGSAAMAVQWVDGMRDHQEAYRSLSLWDNCIFPAEEVTLKRFIELSHFSDEEGDRHAVRCALRSQETHARILKNGVLAIARLRWRATSGRGITKHLNAAREWSASSSRGEGPKLAASQPLPATANRSNGQDARAMAPPSANGTRRRGRIEGLVCGVVFGLLVGAAIGATGSLRAVGVL